MAFMSFSARIKAAADLAYRIVRFDNAILSLIFTEDMISLYNHTGRTA
jgi:hypothetical protein